MLTAMDSSASIALRRLRLLGVPRGAGLSTKHQLGLFTELAGLGYSVRDASRLQDASPSFLASWADTIAALQALRGDDVDYVPLFLGFPNDVPDDNEYFARRIVGYLGNVFGLFESAQPSLENGVVVPTWLFDLREFGADPITQFQTESQWKAARDSLAERVPDGHTEWIELWLAWEDELPTRLQAWLREVLYARSSVKEDLHDDVRTLLIHYGAEAGIDCDRISILETKALVLQTLWEAGRLDAVTALAKTPTDLLRMFAAVTGTDVSLATKVRFPKLGRAQRQAVLTVIDRSASPAEDLARYRGLWLALGRAVHPGEYATRFARAAAAFDRLRNGTIPSFEGQTERLLAKHDLAGVLEHLRARPGVLARRLHELARRFPRDHDAILGAFADVAPKMTVKALLVLRSYFTAIDQAEHRTVINKRGKIKVLPNNARQKLVAPQLQRIDAVLRDALLRQLSTRPSWEGQSVWIDPALADFTVPLQQRTASDGILSFGRGSRVPVAMGKVLRLFVYWKQSSQRTDLDLSLIQFDTDWNSLGHVSYTRLAAEGIVHSGDIQSAPHGAAEFIDVGLQALPAKIRYVAVQVYRFAGEEFRQMQCHAGWMMRDAVDSDRRSFDIATVAHKFDLNGTGSYCVPLVVDLQEQRIVLVDLYMGSKAFHNTVEGSLGSVALACREITGFRQTRPTMAQLAELHVQARGGQRVADRERADITFGIAGCTYDASAVERVLSELL